jgi:hypothetical protein
MKEFETFSERAKSICLAALTIAAEGGKADITAVRLNFSEAIINIFESVGYARLGVRTI